MIYAEKKSFTISSIFGSKMGYFAWTIIRKRKKGIKNNIPSFEIHPSGAGVLSGTAFMDGYGPLGADEEVRGS